MYHKNVFKYKKKKTRPVTASFHAVRRVSNERSVVTSKEYSTDDAMSEDTTSGDHHVSW